MGCGYGNDAGHVIWACIFIHLILRQIVQLDYHVCDKLPRHISVHLILTIKMCDQIMCFLAKKNSLVTKVKKVVKFVG